MFIHFLQLIFVSLLIFQSINLLYCLLSEQEAVKHGCLAFWFSQVSAVAVEHWYPIFSKTLTLEKYKHLAETEKNLPFLQKL